MKTVLQLGPDCNRYQRNVIEQIQKKITVPWSKFMKKSFLMHFRRPVMPGHVKLGKAGEPDPDPAPYLVVTLEMKRADMLKPYDPKKSYWCPDGKGGYAECMLESDDGTKAQVMMGHEVRNL